MKDMIDFPVSDDWLEWYHRQGLTPRRPKDGSIEELGWRLEKIIKDLERRLEILEQNQKMLADAILQRNSSQKSERSERKIEL